MEREKKYIQMVSKGKYNCEIPHERRTGSGTERATGLTLASRWCERQAAQLRQALMLRTSVPLTVPTKSLCAV